MLTQRARLGAAILAVLVLTGTAVAQDRAAGGIPKIDLDPGDAAYWDGYDVRIVRVAVRKQLETVSGGVSTACPDDELSAFIQFGLVSSGLLQYVEVVRSSGLKQCDDAVAATSVSIG